MENLNQILDQMLAEIDNITLENWESKQAPHNWSKKEILGHLEVNYVEPPYQVKNYHQDASVLANQYQNAPLSTIREMWLSLNRHIAYLMKSQNTASLAKSVVLADGTSTDLRWLMEDYVNHLLHHKAQILT